MPIKLNRVALALAAASALGACTSDGSGSFMNSTDNFGEANRQTMAAQVIDPNPEYDTDIPATSAEHAAQAAERYRTDKVKQPDKIQTSTSSSGTP